MATQPLPFPYLSEAQFFAIDETVGVPSDYWDGAMYSMVAASREHALIAVNVIAELAAKLESGPCQVFANGLHVRLRDGAYVAPDLAVACSPKFEQSVGGSLLNPTAIIEILSPSTADYDRGKKWEGYRLLPSLMHYCLIHQDKVHVERFDRHPGGMWMFSDLLEPDATLDLPAIGCGMPIEKIYRRVFEPSS
ncbi:MAG: Uma2 family endonuclease [Bryobacteraceae bacterium]|nr:Uma2 family endonuclease [Bryobacteraceae bacterium]